MAEFDLLGPRARAVLSETPLDIDLAKLQAAFRQEETERRKRAAFADPEGAAPASLTGDQADAAFAAFVEKAIWQKVPGYKPIERVRRKAAR